MLLPDTFTLCVQLLFTQNPLLRLGSMAPGTKIKNLESQAPSGKRAQQPLPVSVPVMLIALPPPAKDYLCLSITSFCFCILLAIPALMFSLKVSTIQLLITSPLPLPVLPQVPLHVPWGSFPPSSPSGGMPLLVPSTPGSC